jgi:hypothetical protein
MKINPVAGDITGSQSKGAGTYIYYKEPGPLYWKVDAGLVTLLWEAITIAKLCEIKPGEADRLFARRMISFEMGGFPMTMKLRGLRTRANYSTDRPPLIGEVSANFLRIKGATWSARWIPTAVLSAF